MKLGSLFSGGGGMDLGLERSGMRCVWQVEKMNYALKILTRHWPKVPKHTDISTFCVEDGPCQDNSIAGSRKGHTGERSGLWKEYRRILELYRPMWSVSENVPGLFSVNHGKDFWGVISDLDSLGYCVAWDVLDSQNFGVAQQRKRVVIVGSLGNIGSAKVLFEQESDCRNNPQSAKGQEISPCVNARSGERNDPQTELVVAPTVRTSESGKRTQGYIANTVTTGQRGIERRPRQGNYISEINPDRKGTAPGVSYELDSPRGIVIGNAVTVNVAKWIGKRIMKYHKTP